MGKRGGTIGLLVSVILTKKYIYRYICGVAYRAEMPPFQETFFSPAEKNVNQHAKISDDLFIVIQLKNGNLRYELCRPLCRPLLACAALNFVRFSRKFYLF